MRYLLTLPPLACAAGYTAAAGVDAAGSVPVGIVWAAAVLAFAYVAGAGSTPGSAVEPSEQFVDAARRLRDDLDRADALRKTIDRSTIAQQGAAERVEAARDRAQALVDELKRGQNDLQAVVVQAIGERDRALAGRDRAIKALCEAHQTAWRLASDAPGDTLILQAVNAFGARLEQLGLSPIIDTGGSVMAEFHSVEAEEDVASERENTVVRILRPGYRAGQEVLSRAAVARGRKASPPAEAHSAPKATSPEEVVPEGGIQA